MAVWRRKLTQRVPIHSDQGSQFTNTDWAALVRAHNLERSMSRRGNCHDNAVAESCFSSVRCERIRCRIYKTRTKPGRTCSITSRCYHNPLHKHVRHGMLIPSGFERLQILKAQGV